MLQSAEKSGSGSSQVYEDAVTAKDCLVALASQHRRSITWLIRAAHTLEIPYIKAYNLTQKDCIWNSVKQNYTVFVRKTQGDPVIIHIKNNVKPVDLAPLVMWWKYPKRPGRLETLKFIRTCLDVLGIAIGLESGLPVGFYEDSSVLEDTKPLKKPTSAHDLQ